MTRRRELSPLVFFYLPPSLWLTCQSEHSQSSESAIFKSCHYTSQVWQKIRKWTTGFNHDRFQVLEIFPEAAPKSWHFLKPFLLWAHVCTLTQSREPHLRSFLLAKHCPQWTGIPNHDVLLQIMRDQLFLLWKRAKTRNATAQLCKTPKKSRK